MLRILRRLAPLLLLLAAAPLRADPLPSWNDGQPKRAITDFVARVTDAGGPAFVPPEQRIAVFDNDGTLWAEQPYYFQFAFAIDRVKAMRSASRASSCSRSVATTTPQRALLTPSSSSLARRRAGAAPTA